MIVEKSALDVTADYVGQTTTKVNDALREAKGGVVFIDEAYNLGEGLYGKEACDTLVAAMTSEEFRDVLIVIAGYPAQINVGLPTLSSFQIGNQTVASPSPRCLPPKRALRLVRMLWKHYTMAVAA